MISLILGGARSGKSALAEKMASESGLAVHYLATAQTWDEEMEQRVAHHQQSRPTEWPTTEEPLEIVSVIKAQTENCLLLDCLTLWLTNILLLEDEQALADYQQVFLDQLQQGFEGHLILVSNEVGQGIVPNNALARRFIDEAGRLHQRIAAVADQVIFVTAGLPLVLKGHELKQ